MERTNGGMQLGRASERCAGETWGNGGREGRRKRPAAKAAAPEHRRKDVWAHAAAGRWGYKAKLNKDCCGKETDPSCRL